MMSATGCAWAVRPPDVYREPLTKLADPQEVDLLEMAKVMGFDLSKLAK
jgi:hypothetical protein